MNELKVIALSEQIENDPDCFIRLCNSPEQQRKRQLLIEQDRRRQMAWNVAKNLAYVAAGAVIALVVIAVIM